MHKLMERRAFIGSVGSAVVVAAIGGCTPVKPGPTTQPTTQPVSGFQSTFDAILSVEAFSMTAITIAANLGLVPAIDLALAVAADKAFKAVAAVVQKNILNGSYSSPEQIANDLAAVLASVLSIHGKNAVESPSVAAMPLVKTAKAKLIAH